MSIFKEVYHFGETSFSNYIWIKGGATFYNPDYIAFEKTTKQPVTVECYDRNGTYHGRLDTPDRANWQGGDLNWLPRGNFYKFKLVNKGSGTVRIKQGDLGYMRILT